jgi:hypothetical protein
MYYIHLASPQWVGAATEKAADSGQDTTKKDHVDK